MRSRKNKFDRLSVWPIIILGLLFLITAANLVRVQALERDTLLDRAVAEGRLLKTRHVKPDRGSIRSFDGTEVAGSVGGYRMTLTPKLLTKSRSFWSEVSTTSTLSAIEGMAFAAADVARDWAEEISVERRRRIDAIRRRYRVDGLGFRQGALRAYSGGNSFARLIGFLSSSGPVGGIEAGLDDVLSGTAGATVGMRDQKGRFLPWAVQSGSSQAVEHGEDVVLTIRYSLQTLASEALARQCEKSDAVRGAAIVIDPATGDIWAAAEWPSFDPADYEVARQQAATLSYPALGMSTVYSSVFEPGSTFKAFTVALALDQGAIDESSVHPCTGQMIVGGRLIRCATDHGIKIHGEVTPAVALERSCNMAAARWAADIGIDPFEEMIIRLGLLESPSLRTANIVAGQYGRDRFAIDLQLATLGFGQSIVVTPVMLCAAFTAFANGGVRVQPRLVHSIGGDVQPYGKRVTVFSESASDQVLTMMEEVVQGEQGTGRSLAITGYRLAGKTGTAEKQGAAARAAEEQPYVSSFVGYVPAESPKAVVLVMLDTPREGSHYGADVAGPVFRVIAKTLIGELGLPRSEVTEH